MTYEIKVRNWWKLNPSWPDGREPCATPWDSCRTIHRCNTEQEAQDYCKNYNATHKPGKLSRKAEYSEV